ncbi:MAG TPA: LLM class flavin-dependent oxidoreductase, partial [Acidimicrobiales bacterium]
MRIGLSGGASSVDKMVEQAQRAEDDGFTSLWYASAIAGDPLAAMGLAGRSTSKIELGTAVLQTYAAHPVLQANRAVAAADVMGRDGLTLGVGPSHQPSIEGMLGLSYARPGQHTEEYVQVLSALLRGETVSFKGDELRVNAAGPAAAQARTVPLLLSA